MLCMILNGELYHHGIKGQRWGVRRFQNPDGTLTDAGKRHYGTTEAFEAKQKLKQARKDYNKAFNKAYDHNHPYSLSKKRREASEKRWEDAYSKADALIAARSEYKTAKQKAREVKDREFAKKRYGISNAEYDKAMKEVSSKNAKAVRNATIAGAVAISAVLAASGALLANSVKSDGVDYSNVLKTGNVIYGPGAFDFDGPHNAFVIKR